MPGPPLPESPPIFYEGFDEPFFQGFTDAQVIVPDVGIFDESWSGYALQREGDGAPPFALPVTNTSGAFRFWVQPNAAPAGGVLLWLDTWTLQISPDRSAIVLLSGASQILSAPISWAAGEPHLVALDFSPQETALFLDGQLAAQGSGVPASTFAVLGSDPSGAQTPNADFDEFCLFDYSLAPLDLTAYLLFTAAQAALGPVSGEELIRPVRDSTGALGQVYDPNSATPCNPGGPPYLTNAMATLASNGTVTASFVINGGQEGVFYDVFTTTNVGKRLANYEWTWIGQGLTCNRYTFSNQLAARSFYTVTASALTAVWGWGDNTYGQCNSPLILTNAVAVAAGDGFSLALRPDGTVLAWGDNSHGQTNLPRGLTNVASIAAGAFHGLARLTNGAVAEWGNYDLSTNLYPVPSNAPYSNLLAVAGSLRYDIGLRYNGTVVCWGRTNDPACFVPTNLTNVAAIDAGWEYNLALLSNGTVRAWGSAVASNLWGCLNVPANLTNVVAISAGPEHAMALRADGSALSWGYGQVGETNVPPGLSSVALSAGGAHSLALPFSGNIVAWSVPPEGAVPTNLVGIKAISAGFHHNLAIGSGMLNPVIFTQPTDQYALAGSNITFSARGQGAFGVSYQWQCNGVNLTNATNATLTLTNVQASNAGNYRVIITSPFGSITSSAAIFALVTPPRITSASPQPSTTVWVNYNGTLSITATNTGDANPRFAPSYIWQHNGTIVGGLHAYTFPSTGPEIEGSYTVIVSNIMGQTSISWTVRAATPGMVESWGSDASTESDRPATLTNAIAIAAGKYHSVALTDDGRIVQWGQYSDGTNLYSLGTAPTFTNLVSVAAAPGHDLALTADGKVTNWGLASDPANFVPTNLPAAKAVACGANFNVALLTNGTLRAWGVNDPILTNIPANVTNIIAISAGPAHTLALKSNGTVMAWGCNTNGETNVPSGLGNVVAVAAGKSHNLALTVDGRVTAWGLTNFGQTSVPIGLSNVMAIAAGDNHSVAMINDGTLVEWGDNSAGQSAVPSRLPTAVLYGPPTNPLIYEPPIVIRQIAATGNHTVAAVFNRLLQYPIDVSKDLLLIYNATNISYSSNVCAYYLSHRPMVSNALRLGISVATNETIFYSDYTNTFVAPLLNWFSSNPTLRPHYVILFQDLPSLISLGGGGYAGVQYDLAVGAGTDPFGTVSNFPASWMPLVTSINMNGVGGTNDCTGYIDKIARVARNNPLGSLIISGTKAGFGNTNWYIDGHGTSGFAEQAVMGVSNTPGPHSITYTTSNYIAVGADVAGYWSGGFDGGISSYSNNNSYATNGDVRFQGTNNWFVMATLDSWNGTQEGDGFQPTFLTWFASSAFLGTNYMDSPIGAVDHVFEPTIAGEEDLYTYYRDWALGKPFGITAWDALIHNSTGNFIHCAAVGDPFVSQ